MIRPFEQSVEEMQSLIAVSRGDAPADLLLTGGKLVNVLSGEIYPAEVVIYGDRIAAVSENKGEYQAKETIDLQGQYMAPGFIDAHLHVESSMLLPAEFANAVLPHGTTSVVSDPHEIANVHGLEGIRYMLAASAGLALRVFVMLSPCVPATDMETAGASLSAEDLASLIDEPGVLGIAEMMNYPGVAGGSEDMLHKASLGHRAGLRVDGHAPMLSGRNLQAYIAAGISSDHESVSAVEALEKLRNGMQVLIREGSTAKNLDALLPIVNEKRARFCSFATDDKQPDDLQKEGHLDHIIRRAIALGLDPLLALQMATVNTARHYGLNDLGVIAPGYLADLVTFADVGDLRVSRTFASGRLVAEGGRILIPQLSTTSPPTNKVLAPGLTESSFAIPANGKHAHIIGVIPEQIVTRNLIEEVTTQNGSVAAAPERDILKIAVVERHKATGHVGVGLVKGFGLREGALASSVAHDSHNVVIVGATDAEMLRAAQTILELGGGICAVRGEHLLGRFPLPVAGLMSAGSLENARESIASLLEAARILGCTLTNPYMAMAFLALPVIPQLKLTDMGLVDVTAFSLCPLFVD